jgi:hypothetical protein
LRPDRPPEVGNRIAAVAAEIAGRDLHAGRRLPPLVFGNVEQMFDPVNEVAVVAALFDIAGPPFPFDQAFQNVIEH